MVPPGRVLLHEDEIQIIWRKKKKKTVLLLFSDMLLVTKKSGRGLMTLEPPLLLQDLMVNDINCGQGRERKKHKESEIIIILFCRGISNCFI